MLLTDVLYFFNQNQYYTPHPHPQNYVWEGI